MTEIKASFVSNLSPVAKAGGTYFLKRSAIVPPGITMLPRVLGSGSYEFDPEIPRPKHDGGPECCSCTGSCPLTGHRGVTVGGSEREQDRCGKFKLSGSTPPTSSIPSTCWRWFSFSVTSSSRLYVYW